MINKNTVIAKIMDMLEMNKNKEIAAYITGVIYDDNEVGFLVGGEDMKIICMHLALIQILADKQNISISDFLKKVDLALSEELDVDISPEKQV